eukprot:172347-Chlamydomonas_euryale.AAC.2
MGAWVAGWVDGRMDGSADGRTDGWMDERTDGWMDEWMDGWMDVEGSMASGQDEQRMTGPKGE